MLRNKEDIWEHICRLKKIQDQSGVGKKKRDAQMMKWTLMLMEEKLLRDFKKNVHVKNKIKSLEKNILIGKILPLKASEEILNIFYSNN